MSQRPRDDDHDTKAAEATIPSLQTNESQQFYYLRLFVSGITWRSLRSIVSITTLCQEMLQGRYRLEVIDVYQNRQASLPSDVTVLPALIRELPLPRRTIIGDLSDKEKSLVEILKWHSC